MKNLERYIWCILISLFIVINLYLMLNCLTVEEDKTKWFNSRIGVKKDIGAWNIVRISLFSLFVLLLGPIWSCVKRYVHQRELYFKEYKTRENKPRRKKDKKDGNSKSKESVTNQSQ